MDHENVLIFFEIQILYVEYTDVLTVTFHCIAVKKSKTCPTVPINPWKKKVACETSRLVFCAGLL